MTYYIGGDMPTSNEAARLNVEASSENGRQPDLPQDISARAAAAFLLRRAGILFDYSMLDELTQVEQTRAIQTYQRLIGLEMGSTFGELTQDQGVEQ